ncbi:MAG: hypothetical protein P8N72_17450, partial [Flavimaricola sp.]|nr:hypothetical protein [Flavimaricola sp.]
GRGSQNAGYRNRGRERGRLEVLHESLPLSGPFVNLGQKSITRVPPDNARNPLHPNYFRQVLSETSRKNTNLSSRFETAQTMSPAPSKAIALAIG